MSAGDIAEGLRARSRAYRKIRQVLNEHKLVLVRVGAYAHEDRAVSEYIERNGATVRNPEHTAIVHALAMAVLS